ncbi:serine acetyltransferase [Vibrio splendidus]|uniref:serine O-acetyltransferase n=1 Tax=Vibrio splendidus TaxID=29497 RepID=UPI000D33D023|nr:serine acetyltransferase [Vibrio splendidus]PTO51481.1 serine acetyltransferase [Vibrio splendidus]
MSLIFFKHDLRSACNSDELFEQLRWFLVNHTLHLVFLIRFGQSLGGIPFIGKVLGLITEYIIRVIYSSDISLKAKLGKGLVIIHGHDIVIGADVVLGNNCKIFNGVTLGNKDISLTSKGNQPNVGDNVTLSTGSKVLGNVFISNNVVIGANSVVLKNCEAHSTYVGIPARKVR